MTTDTAVRSDLPSSSPAETRVVSYLRVSTGRQAESDLSIPDQRRQIERYCAARGWTIVEDYVEPGSSATDDRRPAFQQMIDAALVKPPAFGTILVHSFSRFFRDQFQFERYVRKLAKNGVQVLSITQDMGDNPMGTMMRQSASFEICMKPSKTACLPVQIGCSRSASPNSPPSGSK